MSDEEKLEILRYIIQDLNRVIADIGRLADAIYKGAVDKINNKEQD